MDDIAQHAGATQGFTHEDDQAKLSLGWSLGLSLDEMDAMSSAELMRLAAKRIERDAKIAQHVSALAAAARAAGFDGSSGPAMIAFIQERLASGPQSSELAIAWSAASEAFGKLRIDLGRNPSTSSTSSSSPLNEVAAWSDLLQEATGRIKAQQTTIELLVTGAIKPDPADRPNHVRP